MSFSVYGEILGFVKSAIETLTLDGFDQIVIRKRPEKSSTDQLQNDHGLIIISPGAEWIAEEYTENTQNVVYPVFVTFVQAGDGRLNVQATNDLLAARQAVRMKLHKPAPFPTYVGATYYVFDTTVNLTPAFNMLLFPANYDASQIVFFFKSTESREST